MNEQNEKRNCFSCDHCTIIDNISGELDPDYERELGYCSYLNALVTSDDTSDYWECFV